MVSYVWLCIEGLHWFLYSYLFLHYTNEYFGWRAPFIQTRHICTWCMINDKGSKIIYWIKLFYWNVSLGFCILLIKQCPLNLSPPCWIVQFAHDRYSRIAVVSFGMWYHKILFVFCTLYKRLMWYTEVNFIL